MARGEALKSAVPPADVSFSASTLIGLTTDCAADDPLLNRSVRRRFSKFFGASPEFEINIQMQFDLENKKTRAVADLSKIHTFQVYNDNLSSTI